MELLLRPPGGWEWVIILLAIILLFGAAKIPQVARALGRSKGEFKRGMSDGEAEAKAREKAEEEEDEEKPKGHAPH